MTERERLWHAVVDWEIASKDARADLAASLARVQEIDAGHLEALRKYRDCLDRERADGR